MGLSKRTRRKKKLENNFIGEDKKGSNSRDALQLVENEQHGLNGSPRIHQETKRSASTNPNTQNKNDTSVLSGRGGQNSQKVNLHLSLLFDLLIYYKITKKNSSTSNNPVPGSGNFLPLLNPNQYPTGSNISSTKNGSTNNQKPMQPQIISNHKEQSRDPGAKVLYNYNCTGLSI